MKLIAATINDWNLRTICNLEQVLMLSNPRHDERNVSGKILTLKGDIS